MMVHARISALRQSHWYEYVVRFVLGGLITIITGLIAEHWGPQVGGLFLAFPALFCAGATMIEKHERERKAKLGLQGARRGTDATALDASGAVIGSIGLAAFAATIWLAVPVLGFGGIVLAAVIWPVMAIFAWYFQRHVRQFLRRS